MLGSGDAQGPEAGPASSACYGEEERDKEREQRRMRRDRRGSLRGGRAGAVAHQRAITGRPCVDAAQTGEPVLGLGHNEAGLDFFLLVSRVDSESILDAVSCFFPSLSSINIVIVGKI
jgi:hypothetical protein